METPPRRILIADDEPAVRKMLQVYLVRLGYSVTAVESSGEAWASLENDPGGFDLIVLDATLAGMSLDEMALRMLGAHPDLRVLASSGYPVDTSAIESAVPGRIMFLHKPFTPEALGALVRRMLAHKEEGI